jgi:ATP-binding cassette subfamily B protein
MKRILTHYGPEIRRQKWWFVLTVASITLATITTSVFPFLYGQLVDIISNEPDAANIDRLTRLIWLFGIGYILNWCLYRVHDFAIIRFEAPAIRDLNKRVFKAIQEQSARFFEENFVGSLVKRAGRFVASFETLADMTVFLFLKRGLEILIMLTIFTYYAPWFGMMFFGWTALFIWANVKYARWKLKYDIQAAAADSKIGSVYTDSLTNHQAVRSHGREAFEFNKIEMAANTHYGILTHSWRLNNIAFMMQSALMLSLEFILVLYMANQWELGFFSVEEYVIFQTYLLFLFAGLWDLGRNLRVFFKAYADANEMIDILEQQPDIIDAPNAKKISDVSGSITFKNVNFSYNGGEGEQLQNFNLKIPAGQKVALVGHSGAGKSTIAKLLFRFYDIKSGAILIDDYNIAKVKQCSLRQKITLIPQQPELFHRTVYENIAFGKPNAPKEEIHAAAKKARAEDFINRLPEKYDTIVGERGIKLSGGEKQRIAIARAFLENAPIFILDEATSALDSVTEKQIQKSIFDLMETKTSLVIAHRLSTILHMDRVIVIEHGKIIEDGTHDELIAKNGTYANMWQHQSSCLIADM